MARKNQRNGRFASPARTTANPGHHGPASPKNGARESESPLFETGARQVRELIAGNHSKAAVEIAKDLHKRHATAESEMLLVGAYEARIRDLLKQGMSIEAKSLLNLVLARFPSARHRLEGIEWDVRVSAQDLGALVAPLRDPNLAAETREKIETVIRQRVEDLSTLAQVSSLPSAHPLREGAAALDKAFQAVTSGQVKDDDLRLPEVSRRSPLASWKALIQAIASFYRGEQDSSRKWLEAIAPDSVPARLIEPMQALLGTARGAVLSPAAINLMRSVGSGRKIVQPALASLEEAMRSGKLQTILDRARDAISLCRQCRPELVETLRHHILVRSLLLKVKPDPVFAAIGKPKEDAYWYRLLARGLEEVGGDDEGRRAAVDCWEGFRKRAIQEGWFAANSLEDGLLSLRMARTVSRFPADAVEDWLEDEEDEPMGSGRPGPDGSLPYSALLDPGNLFARACRGDPHPEVFEEWLAWAKQQDHRDADAVATLWAQTRAQDVAPLLWLVESSERRGAYQKSLNFLAQAEQLDQLNPEVHKVRLRLLVTGVLRHFRQRKPHLAVQGIDRIEALPEASEGKLALAIAALRRLCSALDGDVPAATRYHVELEAQLGDSAFVLVNGLVDAAGLTLAEAGLQSPEAPPFAGPGTLACLAKACSLGDLLGIRSAVPEKWEVALSAALATPAHLLDAAQLLVIGEAALRGQTPKLAYAVSAAGLTARTADSRFLFLRGRALPAWASERSLYCLRAALGLARRDREIELAGKVLDLLQDHPEARFGWGNFEMEGDGFSIQPELLQKVLDEERGNDSYPDPVRGRKPAYIQQRKTERENFRKPHRNRRRFYLDDEDDEDDPFDAVNALEDLFRGVPPKVRRRAMEAIERGENPADVLASLVLADVLPEAKAGARKEKPPKSPPAGQQSLF